MPHPLHKISFPARRSAGRRPEGKALAPLLPIVTLLMLLGASCQMFWSPHSPKGYVLPRPELHILDKKLGEISGLFYLKGEGSMLAIADDKKHIYRVYTDGTFTDYFKEEFGESADYEDVVKVDSSVFVLSSDGTVTETIRDSSGLRTQSYHLEVPHAPVTKKDDPGVDFETIYYDSSAHGLILLSKNIKGESKEGVRSAWRFDLGTRTFDKEPFYKFRLEDVNKALKDGQVEFKPSAAAIHPGDHRLYVLSSAGHLLVVADLRGHVQEVYRLNPTFYPQAEGIAFAENGDMYVSNEAKLGKASLLRIPYVADHKGRN